jgi:hypothetical protein
MSNDMDENETFTALPAALLTYPDFAPSRANEHSDGTDYVPEFEFITEFEWNEN